MSNEKSRNALWFVILMGLISLLADMTYESARGLNGQYLEMLGATATVVGFVAGMGELLGFGLRLLSGIISDRTRRYWAITIFGYSINLLAVPALALTNHWPAAAALMMTERIGKAIRTPARDAMLSHAAYKIGAGRAFALHEAMDQIGGMLGPLIVTFVLAIKGSYQWAFGVLAIPAVMALAVLATARIVHPQPQNFEPEPTIKGKLDDLPKAFWLYIPAVGLIAAAFADYPLIAFHLKSAHILQDKWIPLLYAGAMGVDALAALFFGRLYDRRGLPAFMIAVGIAAFFAPLVFSRHLTSVILGMTLWGLGMGAQESIMRAELTHLVPKDLRATGFGIFNAGFGLAWFLGSVLMGFLYDFSLQWLIIFSVTCQLAAIPALFLIQRLPQKMKI